ncbi:MAG: transporter [Tepidiforma sp.]|uniref:Formate/nitrite transporter family protein n=1 Tax=Tepidiforma bonchosmolovskayae TaxID=2601677 RepID=A0ABX6C5W4_9CHLR|nr:MULTISPECIES: formate/nitrite transporter family protein [Tepidiforma]QFG03640.1 formate/nitrite transporter family protein [Tepidiforma bonchosmolovskayae]GIW16561.1 MAG: transporter [Tepidiforma sp.]
MTADTLDTVSRAAAAKATYLREKPVGYLVLSALAGAYVGFGIVLIFAIGAPLSATGSPFLKFVMGASFGIALSLVVVAGSELFTGNTMVMTVGAIRRAISPAGLANSWVLSLAGNLVGSLALAWLVAQSGALANAPQADFIQKTAAAKMTLPLEDAFLRGILCNWLVCLAVWSAMRQQSEAGKLIMIFWCLFAFIGAGFEHSIANMTLLGIALFQPHADPVSWGGFVHNLVPVTLGNVVGGALFVAGAYLLANARIVLPSTSPAPASMGEPARD